VGSDRTVIEIVRALKMSRGDDVDLTVELPAEWAREHQAVQVRFRNTNSRELGWHAWLESAAGDPLLTFPWHDHVDRMLRGEVPSQLPDPALPRGAWDDLEEGWWASVRRVGDAVLIAETDIGLTGVRGIPEPRLIRPGLIDVGGVELRWSRVPRTAWEAAWAAARESCLRGSLSPVAGRRRIIRRED
jgi:hypothetical protein